MTRADSKVDSAVGDLTVGILGRGGREAERPRERSWPQAAIDDKRERDFAV